MYLAKGDPASALGPFRAATEIREQALGAAHRLTHNARVEVATALSLLGRCGEAEPLLATALPGLEKNVGPEHPDLVLALVARGRCAVAGGRAAAAVADVERAVAIAEKAKIPVVDRGSARWQLALSLAAAGRRDAAVAAARQAERELATDGDGAHELSLARAWLRRGGG